MGVRRPLLHFPVFFCAREFPCQRSREGIVFPFFPPSLDSHAAKRVDFSAGNLGVRGKNGDRPNVGREVLCRKIVGMRGAKGICTRKRCQMGTGTCKYWTAIEARQPAKGIARKKGSAFLSRFNWAGRRSQGFREEDPGDSKKKYSAWAMLLFTDSHLGKRLTAKGTVFAVPNSIESRSDTIMIVEWGATLAALHTKCGAEDRYGC